MPLVNKRRIQAHSFAEIADFVAGVVNNGVVSRVIRSAAEDPSPVAPITSRLAWYKEIREYIKERDVDDTVIDCGSCGAVTWLCQLCCQRSTVGEFEIDHIAGWKKYILSYATGKSMTPLQARILFNSPFNLRAICSTCNGAKYELKPPAHTLRSAPLTRRMTKQNTFTAG